MKKFLMIGLMISLLSAGCFHFSTKGVKIDSEAIEVEDFEIEVKDDNVSLNVFDVDVNIVEDMTHNEVC